MFDSTVLDVATGVIFGFLAVSLFTSAAVEAINSILKLRARSLVSGIKELVNDPDFTGLAKSLYRHAAVSPRGPGGDKPLQNFPAYIDGMQFVSALLDITGLSAASATQAAQAPGPQAVAALKTKLSAADSELDPQLKQLIEGVIDRSAGDIKAIKTELASWFDVGMDRLSGAFKRWTQLATFVIALIIAALVNLDAVQLATRLWEQPILASRLKAPTTTPTGTDLKEQETDANQVLKAMLEADLPVGWSPGHFMQVKDVPTEVKAQPGAQAKADAIPPAKACADPQAKACPEPQAEACPDPQAKACPNPPTKPVADKQATAGADPQATAGADQWGYIWKSSAFFSSLFGWMITAVAALFGAPFWFDTLQSVIRLKGSGPSPAEKAKNQAAAS